MKKMFCVVLICTSQLTYAKWTVEVAPYIWASGLSGTQHTAGLKFKVSESFSELLRELDFGAMLWLAAYHDNAGIFFNGIYSKVSDKLRIDRLDIDLKSTLSIDSLGISYRLGENKEWYFEPYAGARYTLNDNKVTINTLGINQKYNWTDAIAGTRLNYNVTSAFNVEGAADYGQGSHSHSYNFTALLGYQSPHHFKNTRFYLGYRFLHQNYHHGTGLRYYEWNMNIHGPVAGMLFRF
ncbi:MAG: hypothetical protein Q8M40_12805 [Legionella sp.]|nr:hypothetical protein [Legionella sp.]